MHKWQPHNLVIRICFSNDQQVDWNVPVPESITFQDVIDVISQVSKVVYSAVICLVCAIDFVTIFVY